MGNTSVEEEDLDISERQLQKERKDKLKENETSQSGEK
jgi:hypothetical protein